MGLFYEHVTMYGPQQSVLAEYMRESGRQGFVSPTIDDATVVYDKASAEDVSLIFDLASELSARFNCAALAVHILDSDVLYYQLFNNGILIDRYDSCPAYFDANAEYAAPTGGDATILCAAFEALSATEVVSAVLRHDDVDEKGDDGEFWLAEERHEKLAQTMSWPSFVPNIGYGYLAEYGFVEGFDATAFIRVGA